MGREAGFTLLEVLVAFIIAALALAALFSGALGGLRAAATSGRYLEAVSRAESHLAAATTGDALAAGDRQGDEGAGFHWHVRIAPAQVATMTNLLGGLMLRRLALGRLRARADAVCRELCDLLERGRAHPHGAAGHPARRRHRAGAALTGWRFAPESCGLAFRARVWSIRT